MAVCLISQPTLILLVLVLSKILSNYADTEAQVIAEAIATFQFNNQKRVCLGLLPLAAMTIPCIMSGTRPTFYLVPVTAALSAAVITGQETPTLTTVLRCATMLTHSRRARLGMDDVEYRQLAFKRFLAFKDLAKDHWSKILEGV